MFKIEMTFYVPDDALKFVKNHVLYEGEEPTCIVELSSNIKDGEETIIEGVKYVAKDQCPHLPDVIDGSRYKTLTEKEQELYSFVEDNYLFDYQDSYSCGPTEELSAAEMFETHYAS